MASEVLPNGNTMEFTNTIGSLSVERIDPGFDTERVKFSFSGRVKNNTPTSIGELKISAASNKYIHKSPTLSQTSGLEFDSKLKAKLKSQTKNSRGKITTYTYDLIYTAKEDVLITNPLSYEFENETKADITTKQTGITRVLVNTDTIHHAGERRKITIYGTPRTEFQISVTKITDYIDTDRNITNSTDTSILSNSNSTLQLDNSETIKTIKGNIDNTGKKVIMQKFPSSSTSDQRYAINLYAKDQDFSKAFEDKGTGDGSEWIIETPWSDWYRKIITQQPAITVTFKATTDSGAGLVNLAVGEGAAQTFNSSAPVSFTKKGIYKSTKGLKNSVFSVKYTYKALSGSWSIKSGGGGAVSYTDGKGDSVTTNNVFGNPVFSHTVATNSDWTNTVTKTNGGLYMNIYNIKTVLSDSNKTATITFDVNIYNWGTKDRNITLALNSIVQRV